jgi:hypothetical protein
MTNLLFINVCLAAGNNIEGWWLQILFPILIAIVLAISGIFTVKSRQSKADNNRMPEQLTQSSHMRIQVNSSSAHINRDKFNIKQQHYRHKPVDRNRPQKSIEPNIIVSQTIDQQIKESMDLTPESFNETEAISIAIYEELLDFNSQDQLKILLKEILEKPLSMRDFENC